MDYIALGRRIREERLKMNLTQEKLAEDIDISTAYVGQIERGDRNLTLDKLVLIAKRLGITVDYLLSDSVPVGNTTANNLINQIMHNRSENERLLAVNMLKLIFSFFDTSKTED
jgi:transcriptional regulator with XRE-family HTH domain